MEYQTNQLISRLSFDTQESPSDSDQIFEFRHDCKNSDRLNMQPDKNLPHSFEFIPKTLLSLSPHKFPTYTYKDSSLNHSHDSCPQASSTDYSVSDQLDQCDTEETDLSVIHLSAELKRDYLFSTISQEDDASSECPVPFEINFQDMEEDVAPLPLPSSEFYRESDIAYKRTPRKNLKFTRPPVEKLNIFR